MKRRGIYRSASFNKPNNEDTVTQRQITELLITITGNTEHNDNTTEIYRAEPLQPAGTVRLSN